MASDQLHPIACWKRMGVLRHGTLGWIEGNVSCAEWRDDWRCGKLRAVFSVVRLAGMNQQVMRMSLTRFTYVSIFIAIAIAVVLAVAAVVLPPG
jgi:hypothetical protein